MAEPWAHSGGHLLEDHLQAVAGAAAELAETLDGDGRSARWAAIAISILTCELSPLPTAICQK